MSEQNKDSTKPNAAETKFALLLIDVISDFEFEDGEKIFVYALPMARRLAEFRRRAKDAKVPVIYINDNFGKWQEDFKQMVKHYLDADVRGHEIVELLKPDEDDFYVLKPKHSAFFSTTLDLLLKNLEAETLILTGISTDICVQFSAGDAYMRDFQLLVPSDCAAAVNPADHERALEYMQRVLKADTRPSTEIEFEKLN